jgi:hypothetical protein
VLLLKVRKDKVVERKNNMSKYNLTDILNEYVGGSRIGTLNISFKELSDKMEDIDMGGDYIVRRSGTSGDGKVNREFEVVAREDAIAGGNKQEKGFTVYDYKFGFDPGDEDNYMEEYDFSVGGSNLELAMELFDGVKPFGIRLEGEFDEARQAAIESSQEEAGIKEEYDDDRIISAAEANMINRLRYQVMMLDKGHIDKDDFINAVEEIAFGRNKGPMNENYIGDQKLSDLLNMGTADMNLWHVVKLIDAGILNDSDKLKALKALDPNRKLDEVMNIDRKGNKKPEYKSNLTNIDEAVAEEESVANYLMDYYRNPNKPEETMVDEKVVGEYFNTHEDWDMIWGKSYKDGLRDFEEFFDANYGYMFPSAGDLDEDLKEHFKRFM